MIDLPVGPGENPPSMKTRRVTANLPEELLREAQALSGQGITETLVLGLEWVIKAAALQQAARLKGKIHLRADEGRKPVGTRN
jgi:hypothetical protein